MIPTYGDGGCDGNGDCGGIDDGGGGCGGGAGAEVNVRDHIWEQTPLHRVCYKGQLEKDIYSEDLVSGHNLIVSLCMFVGSCTSKFFWSV
jgi:hypothetical protein